MWRQLSIVLGSCLLMSCGYAKLPPPEQLESGCYVWHTSDGKYGIFAEVSPAGVAKVRRRGQTTEAALSPSGEVLLEWGRSIPVARLDGPHLLVTDLGEQFTPAFVGFLDPGSLEIAFWNYESRAPWTKLRRSASCTPTQTVVGAGPVAYYVNWEFRMRIPPPLEKKYDPKRPYL
jgi:hypothetical protein